MNILQIFGKGVGTFLSGGTGEIMSGAGVLIKGIGEAATEIREVITGDMSPEKREAALSRLSDMIMACNDMQGRINLIESQSSSIFVAGWRPALGWVCAFSLAVYYPTRIIVSTFFWCRLAWSMDTLPLMPEMGMTDILGLVTSLLGMAGLRTFEKTRDVQQLH